MNKFLPQNLLDLLIHLTIKVIQQKQDSIQLQIIYSMKHPMAYKEDFTCIIDSFEGKGGLFIGNLEAAQNIATLQKNKIKAILTAARGIKLIHKRQQIPYYLHIHADDHEQFELSKYFNQAANFIRDALQKTNVMVHCLAGVSRSVSLVIAYFIKHNGKSYEEAYSFVKEKRRVANPNLGFVKQLKRYQQQNSHKKEIKDDQGYMPLKELQIGNRKNIQYNSNSHSIKQNKQNNTKPERIPGRIKRFNSVIQPHLTTKDKKEEQNGLPNYQERYRIILNENIFKEVSNNVRVISYKQDPMQQRQYKQTYTRSYL